MRDRSPYIFFRKMDHKICGWILTLLLLMPAILLGQMARPLAIDENARFSASASSSYQFKASLDGGGDVSIAHYGVRVGVCPWSSIFPAKARAVAGRSIWSNTIQHY